MSLAIHSTPRIKRMAYAIQLVFIGSALLLNVQAPALAQESAAAPATSQDFQVPAGDLAAALRQVASQSRVILSFAPEQTRGKTSAGLIGRHDVLAALNGVLRGTGLKAERSANGSYVLRPAQSESGADAIAIAIAMMPEVSVKAQQDATEGSGAYVSALPVSTATPLGLSIRETPQSVSVITQQRMQDQGLSTIAQVMAQTPGITLFSLGSERTGFTSRGYSITNYQLDGVSTHSENLGLNAIPSQSLADMALYDRIEVLRGASGLMTGAGDASGAINMVRKKPTAQFQASVEGELGSYDERRGMADIAGPLNEARTVRGRLVTVYEEGDGIIDGYSRDKKVVYGVVEADLSAGTKLTAGVTHQRKRSNGSLSYLGFPLFYSNGAMTDLPRSFSPAAKSNRFDTKSTDLFATLEHALANDWKLKISANRVQSSQEERSIYLDVSGGFPDQATGDGLLLNADYRDYQLQVNSVDVNVRGPFSAFGRQHELVLGMDYSEFQSTTDGRFGGGVASTPANLYRWNRTATPAFGNAVVTYDSTRRQASAYAATRLNLSERLKLIAGAKVLRYSENYISDAPSVNFYSASPASESRVFTPYGGLVFDIDGTHSAYASYSTIYQPQASQDRYGKLLAPREGKTFEAGIKSGWLDGRLNTAAALYQIRQSNLAESDPGYTVPGTNTPANRTIKGAKTQGVDLEATGAITPSWNISASWSYSQTENNTGKAILTTFPRHLVKLWTTWRLPGELHRLTLGGGVNWQSRVYSDIDAWQINSTLHWEQKAYSVASLMARYDVSDKLSATVNVANLFDKKYTASVSDWWYSGMHGPARKVALTVRYQF
ncbi:iron complex outermembrane receptor protein/outer membrane receptor for ferric coprogen and ferric-rhodotorulic acid [Janthinobacterium sp. 35]|uniref:TonB-dependent siderophore receptor n=1 Tax=Janthinobacterium sp. 35 TaxID=2035210 RepID=UPI000C5A1596|nr:TonB-dependent receptor [Janthinobacterium sp. 35]PIG26323.1 iron complex outermembrane receptor protein/outer membrane receptor for ferric coprogen and ferric-rhodotorulic acid [Janthinobacterium sp. 35]